MNSDSKLITRYGIKAYLDEVSSSYIYRRLAKIYRGRGFSKKLMEAAEEEERHAEIWRRILKKYGVHVDKLKPNRIKLRLLLTLYRVLGLGLTLRLLEKGEEEAINIYTTILDEGRLDQESEKLITDILKEELGHEEEFIEEEGRLKEFIEHIRDAILGMSDGLVEILSVSAGLAGAYGNPLYVALGGLIVGIGGALSMAIGSYISVKAEREVGIGVFTRMAKTAKYAAEILINRLVEKLKDKGFSEDSISKIKNDLESDRELLGKVAAEEEYGVKMEAIENPAKSGLYTGIFYIVGSIFPLIPYFMMIPVSYALPASFVLAGLLLAFTGFIIAVSARLKASKKVLEMSLAGIGAAFITYLIGLLASILFGIQVS